MVTELIWKLACSIDNDYDTLPAELKEKDTTKYNNRSEEDNYY